MDKTERALEEFRREVSGLINALGIDKQLHIPDYILARSLSGHLENLHRLGDECDEAAGEEPMNNANTSVAEPETQEPNIPDPDFENWLNSPENREIFLSDIHHLQSGMSTEYFRTVQKGCFNMGYYEGVKAGLQYARRRVAESEG